MKPRILFATFGATFGATLLAPPLAGAVLVNVELIRFDGPARTFVPLDDNLGQTWTVPGFDDSGWIAGNAPVGYGYDPSPDLIQNTNVALQMRGISPSAFVRVPFNLDITNISQVQSLGLDIYADDGFIAYLNGVQVVVENVAAVAPGWDIRAASAGEARFGSPSSFNLDAAIGNLVPGANVLAIHGVNNTLGSSDFLVAPILSASIDQVPEPHGAALFGISCLLAARRKRS
jgi:hypothetical protein